MVRKINNGKNNCTLKNFSNLPQNINKKKDIHGTTMHMLTLALQTHFLYRIYKEEKLPINYMACISSALVGLTLVLSYVYIQTNLFLSWASSSVETQTICFLIFGKTLDHVIRQSNISTSFPSLCHGPLCNIANVLDTRTGSKLWFCKTREWVSLFISLTATALSFHIFGDLEDFSWTDSKWSSFSYGGKI